MSKLLIGNTVVYSYFNDSPVVPKHLTHKITQEAWDWINAVSNKFYSRQETYGYGLDVWQIRGYLFIPYFMNPSQENLDHMLKILREYSMLMGNLEQLEFRYDLNTMLRSVYKEICVEKKTAI